MKVVALDDESIALAVLVKAIEGALPDSEVTGFELPYPALEYVKSNDTDVVFCDYSMPGMNGIEFAQQVKEVSPKTDIVFVTGYDEYAVEAVNAVSPQGYIVKPVSKSKIQAVLKNLHTETVKKGIYVQTFGMFNVFYDGVPVEFKVKKARELLAYLIDSGGECSRRDLTAVLYEDRDEKNAVRYFANAIKCLTSTLKEIDAEDILIHRFNSYSVDRSRFTCDLYDYLDGNVNLFRGEYMSQYSWAEMRVGTFSSENI